MAQCCCKQIGAGCPQCHGLYGAHKEGCTVLKNWEELAESLAGKLVGKNPFGSVPADAPGASTDSPASEARSGRA